MDCGGRRTHRRQEVCVEGITSQHGLLVLGSADEPADALDHLALRLHLLVFALFWQEHDWQREKNNRDTRGEQIRNSDSFWSLWIKLQ